MEDNDGCTSSLIFILLGVIIGAYLMHSINFREHVKETNEVIFKITTDEKFKEEIFKIFDSGSGVSFNDNLKVIKSREIGVDFYKRWRDYRDGLPTIEGELQ